MNPAPQFVEILTWNDYGEATYIGPVSTAYSSGITWVSGQNVREPACSL